MCVYVCVCVSVCMHVCVWCMFGAVSVGVRWCEASDNKSVPVGLVALLLQSGMHAPPASVVALVSNVKVPILLGRRSTEAWCTLHCKECVIKLWFPALSSAVPIQGRCGDVGVAPAGR